VHGSNGRPIKSVSDRGRRYYIATRHMPGTVYRSLEISRRIWKIDARSPLHRPRPAKFVTEIPKTENDASCRRYGGRTSRKQTEIEKHRSERNEKKEIRGACYTASDTFPRHGLGPRWTKNRLVTAVRRRSFRDVYASAAYNCNVHDR